MKAVVNAPICPLMSEPRSDCSLADEALYGMVVEVLEQTTPGYWRVRTHYRYEGYAPVACLAIGDETAAEWAALPKKVVLRKSFCDVLCYPKYQSWPRITLPLGAVVAVTESPETDSESGGPTGWQAVTLVGGNEGYVRSGWLDTFYDKPIRLPEKQLRQRLVDTALLFTHTPYRWGGKTPLGIDCSGLVSMSYLLNGIVIWRDARIMDGFPIRPIRREAAEKGDLLFFPGHVAMYLGDGLYIHSTGKAGSDGVCFNSLVPVKGNVVCKDLYREDLDKSLIAVGTYF